MICQNGIILNDVSFAYSKKQYILKNISLIIPEGSFLGIIGANGSGKSTFSYLLNGLIPHVIKGDFSGEVYIDGISSADKNVAYFATRVGMLFQNPDFSLFNLTVREEIAFGLKQFNIKDEALILKSLQMVGMGSSMDRDPQTLSLGEKQKICLACVLALNTKYIILDEPIAMLDYNTSLEIYNILLQLNQRGRTILVIEHDTDFLWKFVKNIILLYEGRVFANDCKHKILTDKELLQNYGIKPPYVQ